MPQYNGILLCDKPYKLSSHDVINKLRLYVGQRKIGHTGTLDPRATGLLVTCLGRATKIAQFLAATDKTYEVEITLGQKSSTFDSEGIIDSSSQTVPELDKKQLNNILEKFRGKIKQKVPAYSAVKVAGKRLYKLAREGKKIDTPEREIDIKEILLIDMTLPVIRCRVTCSKGTYIRTLANDIGDEIGCGAYLSSLKRTQVGKFSIKDALTLTEIKHLSDAGKLKKHLIPIETALQYPSIKVDVNFTSFVISGKSPRFEDVVDISGEFDIDEFICLTDHNGRIMAVGKAEIKSSELNEKNNTNFFKYVRVLN